MDEVVEIREILRGEVDAPKAGVGVRGGERHEAVGEVVGRDDVRETGGEERRSAHGTVPVADDGLHDHHGEVVRRAPADALHSDGDVRGRHVVVPDADFGPHEGRFRVGESAEGDGAGRDGQCGEMLFSELDEFVVVHSARADEHHAVGCVVCLDVVGQVIPFDGEDVVLGSEDGSAKGLTYKTKKGSRRGRREREVKGRTLERNGM